MAQGAHHPTPIHIRKARVADIPFIRSLKERFVAVGSPLWRDLQKMQVFHDNSIEEACAAIVVPDALVLLAEEEQGTLLGFLHAQPATDFFTGDPQGYVSALAVVAEAEGMGIGSLLMEQAEHWARAQGYHILTLETFGENTRARAFYQHLGYKEETVKLIKEL